MNGRIYVTTQRKRNNSGFGLGEWFELNDFADKKTFIQACLDFHNDEPNPQLHFVDYIGVPHDWINDSDVSQSVWEWMALDPVEAEMYLLYGEYVNASGDINDAREAYQGRFASLEEWAIDYWEQTGLIQSIPDALRFHINFKSWARACEMGGDITAVDVEDAVHIFQNH